MPKIPTYSAQLLPESKTPTTGLRSAPLDLLTPVPRVLGAAGAAVEKMGEVIHDRAVKIKDDRDTVYAIKSSTEANQKLQAFSDNLKTKPGAASFNGIAELDKETKSILDDEKGKEEFKNLSALNQTKVIDRINDYSLQYTRTVAEYIRREQINEYNNVIAISLEGSKTEAASGGLESASARHNENLTIFRDKGLISDADYILHKTDGNDKMVTAYVNSIAMTNPLRAYRELQIYKVNLSANNALQLEISLKPRADAFEIDEFTNEIFDKNPGALRADLSALAKIKYKGNPDMQQAAIKNIGFTYEQRAKDKAEAVAKIEGSIYSKMFKNPGMTLGQLRQDKDMVELDKQDPKKGAEMIKDFETRRRLGKAETKEDKNKHAINYAAFIEDEESLRGADLTKVLQAGDISSLQFTKLSKSKDQLKRFDKSPLPAVELQAGMRLINRKRDQLGDEFPQFVAAVELYVTSRGSKIQPGDTVFYVGELLSKNGIKAAQDFFKKQTEKAVNPVPPKTGRVQLKSGKWATRDEHGKYKVEVDE